MVDVLTLLRVTEETCPSPARHAKAKHGNVDRNRPAGSYWKAWALLPTLPQTGTDWILPTNSKETIKFSVSKVYWKLNVWFSGVMTYSSYTLDCSQHAFGQQQSDSHHSKTLCSLTHQTDQDWKYSMCLSVQLNGRKDVVISLASFQIPLPLLKAPSVHFSPRFKGLKAQKRLFSSGS